MLNLASWFKKNKRLYSISRKIYFVFRKKIIGRNNQVINNGVSYKLNFDIIGNNNQIIIDSASILLETKIFIRGNNHKIYIGKNCVIRGGVIWLEDSNNEIKIGDNTTIESVHLSVVEMGKKILIGENCMFSNDVELRVSDSHSIMDLRTNQRINHAADITIGNHVWLGSNSVILKGVMVGENSIISTRAVVTRNVPPNSLVGGIPAKLIKENINWDRSR